MSQAFCDGLSRRNFLQIGGLAVGGLSLADLLHAAQPGAPSLRHKSVIMVFLPGGPSHIDICDLKPAAPAEIRGPIRSIATSVPGIEICEYLPRLARIADKFVLLRSITGGPDEHACHMCLTGWAQLGPQPSGGWPSFGAVVSKLMGPTDPAMPENINLAARMSHHPYNDPGPGFLGLQHAAYNPDEAGRANLVLNGVTLDRLDDRKRLLAAFDRSRREIARRAFLGLDAFQAQALEVLTSSRMYDALELSHEDPRVLDRYGEGTSELVTGFNAAPRLTRQFLIAPAGRGRREGGNFGLWSLRLA